MMVTGLEATGIHITVFNITTNTRKSFWLWNECGLNADSLLH